MNGYIYGQNEPTENCPYCELPCVADFVDIGVGYQQCGPYHCDQCGASEIGPYDDPRTLTEQEQDTGWYGPEQPPGSSANVIHGKVVKHTQMERAYRDAIFSGKINYEGQGEVERWFSDIRK